MKEFVVGKVKELNEINMDIKSSRMMKNQEWRERL